METSISLRFRQFAFSSATSVITVDTAATHVAVALTSAHGSLTYFTGTCYTLNGTTLLTPRFMNALHFTTMLNMAPAGAHVEL